MSKASELMRTAQFEKTRQTMQRLMEWYSTKEQFYKQYLPIQQAIIGNTITAANLTIERLKQMSQMVKEEKQYQTYHYEKCDKNVLSNPNHFGPQYAQSTDPKGSKVKVELPSWSSNTDKVFLSLSKQQQNKQAQIKKIYKTLESIQDAFNKEENRYKTEIKKHEKELASLFDRIDTDQKEQTRIVGKLLKQSKSSDLKQSFFFISELKKVEHSVLDEISCFAERGQKLIHFIKVILKLEKQVAKTVKQNMSQFLNYRTTLLGYDTKGQEQIYGHLALCEDKVSEERLAYFNKVMLPPNKILTIQQLLKEDTKNSWEAIVKFLQKPAAFFNDAMKASQTIQQIFRNISYKCWLDISLAQGWFIESYTASVMYMTYDSIMIIYSREGQCLKKIHTSASKINKIEGNTIFLQEKIKGFFSDSLEEYKVRFGEIERLEEFQLFMENQIK